MPNSVTGLPNVAALLAEATPGPWGTREGDYRVLSNVGEAYPAGTGRFGYWDDAQLAGAAPVLAAALIEAADALERIADPSSELERTTMRGNPSDAMLPYQIARAALARLVAFDASLKETTE